MCLQSSVRSRGAQQRVQNPCCACCACLRVRSKWPVNGTMWEILAVILSPGRLVSLSRLGTDQRGLAPESPPRPSANEQPPSVPTARQQTAAHVSLQQSPTVVCACAHRSTPPVWFAGRNRRNRLITSGLPETSLFLPPSPDGGSASRCQTSIWNGNGPFFVGGPLAGRKMAWSCS